MIKKKISMIGAFAVGKTSLVQRYVNSIFSEKYQTTIGVKIDQKNLTVEGHEMTLLIWDIHGEDDFMKVKPTYLIGSSGYLLVIDGTRKDTLATAVQLQQMAANMTKNAPFLTLINKADIAAEWELRDEEIENLKKMGWDVILTSAKDDLHVEEAFQLIGKRMLKTDNKHETES